MSMRLSQKCWESSYLILAPVKTLLTPSPWRPSLGFDFHVVKTSTSSGLESTTLLSIYYNSKAVPSNAFAGDSKVAVPLLTCREHPSLPPSFIFPTMSSNDDSVYNIDNASLATSTPDDEIESLPDSAPSDDTDDDDEQEETDAEKEWKESLQQLELILTMVLVPYAGKYFGRKCAYWGEHCHYTYEG